MLANLITMSTPITSSRTGGESRRSLPPVPAHPKRCAYDSVHRVRAATKLQRALLRNRLVYRHFAPALFVNSDGESIHGRIKFEGATLCCDHGHYLR